MSNISIDNEDVNDSSSTSSTLSHTHTTRVPLDHHVKKIMLKDLLTDNEIAYFYEEFLKMDAYDSHRITMPQFYTFIEERRTELGDALFDILGYEYNEGMTFGEFLSAVVTMCLMEKSEVLQMIFYVFDKDKNGFISKREMRDLLKVFREVLDDGSAHLKKQNSDLSMDRVPMPNDGLIEFDELCRIIKSNKAMNYAAFSLQNKMMARFKGHAFWRHKNRIIGKAQKHEDVTLQAYRTKKKRVYKRCRARALRRRLGLFTYYFRVIFRRPLTPGIKSSKDNNSHFPTRGKKSAQVQQEKPIDMDELLANIHSAYRNSIYPIHRMSEKSKENDFNLGRGDEYRSCSHFSAAERRSRLLNRRASRPLKRSLSLHNINENL